jgi:hypothetical protein
MLTPPKAGEKSGDDKTDIAKSGIARSKGKFGCGLRHFTW